MFFDGDTIGTGRNRKREEFAKTNEFLIIAKYKMLKLRKIYQNTSLYINVKMEEKKSY